jgi:hypothetical protein
VTSHIYFADGEQMDEDTKEQASGNASHVMATVKDKEPNSEENQETLKEQLASSCKPPSRSSLSRSTMKWQ